MTRQEFGDRVWTHRTYRNIRQAELAKTIGLSRASLSNIERGAQVVTLDTINKIAAAFGITMFQMMYTALPAITHPVRRPAADTAKPSPEEL